jgi:rhodanese-related sulfurtransferase
MKKMFLKLHMEKIYYIFLFWISAYSFSQSNLDTVLKKMNQNSVPYIQVENLKKESNCFILDAREKNEYEVSHIKNALFIGYTKFNFKNVCKQIPEKNAKIIVYCSIGVRSEQIGEKLIKAGYTNVQNLYGGIFEWKNKGGEVVNSNNEKTEKVHAYDKNWGVYLKKGEKVY